MMIVWMGGNCGLSVCPGKGQEKDGEKSEMIGFEIFIEVVPHFPVALMISNGLISWDYHFMYMMQ